MVNCEEHDRDNEVVESDEIWITQFTEKSAQQFRRQVLKKAADSPDKPIVIYIDSYGGYVDSLATMLETMDEVPNPFITVASGKSMSCGAVLLSHGDYRFCGQYSRVMVHEISGFLYGNVRSLTNDAVEMVRLNVKVMDLLAKNCGFKGYQELKEVFKKKDADELWMGPDDALKFGIVDHVGMPKVIPVAAYQCAIIPPKPSRRDKKPTKKEKPNKPTGEKMSPKSKKK